MSNHKITISLCLNSACVPGQQWLGRTLWACALLVQGFCNVSALLGFLWIFIGCCSAVTFMFKLCWLVGVEGDVNNRQSHMFSTTPLVLLPVKKRALWDTCCKKTTARPDCGAFKLVLTVFLHTWMFSNVQLLWNQSQQFGDSSRPVELKFVALLNILGVGMKNVPFKKSWLGSTKGRNSPVKSIPCSAQRSMHSKEGSTKFSQHCAETCAALRRSMENMERVVVTAVGTYIIPNSMKKSEKHANFQITSSAVQKRKQDLTSYPSSCASAGLTTAYSEYNGMAYLFPKWVFVVLRHNVEVFQFQWIPALHRCRFAVVCKCVHTSWIVHAALAIRWLAA